MTTFDPETIEQKVEAVAAAAEPVNNPPPAVRAGAITVNEKVGGMLIETVDHLFKIADTLSRAGVAVPPHCRGTPGTVFALLIQSQEWGLPFMSVINKSYVTKGKGGVERIGYEAQLIHTLIETRAGLKSKLRVEYIGEGDDMVCKVIGTFKGEDEPHVWESEKLGKIRADIGFNDENKFKGSPLWMTKPKVQLFYSTSRDWARIHCPWVILGVYTPEEIEEAPAMQDVTPKISTLVDRLKAAKRETTEHDRGFNADHIKKTIEGTASREAETEETDDGGKKDSGAAGGDASEVRERDADDQRDTQQQGTGGSPDESGGHAEGGPAGDQDPQAGEGGGKSSYRRKGR